MSRWIDCSPPITPDLPVWPGDTPMSLERTLRLEHGATVNLGAVRATVHLGAHADAPFHCRSGGLTIDRCPVEPFLGPALVLDLRGVIRGEDRRITPAHLESRPEFSLLQREDAAREPAAMRLPHDTHRAGPRVLLRTGTFFPEMRFDDRFASLHPETIDRLADLGAPLIGLDTPSVDPFSSKSLDAHHRLADRGLFNLEGLYLEEVSAGWYDLVAVPLRLVGLDASPVRALLRPRDPEPMA